jgi:hypothetical protein
MTQEMAVDVTPEAAGDVSFPRATISGKTVMAATFRASEVDQDGRIHVDVTSDEFTADVNINGQPSPPMLSNPLAGKTYQVTYSSDGSIVDMKGPPGTDAMIEAMKRLVEQMSGKWARVQLAVGEMATLPLDIPLPAPLAMAGGLGVTGETTVTLVSLEADGADRIASCENVFRASMARTFQAAADGAGGGVGIDVKMSGTGTAKIDVDRHVMRSNDGTITIDGTVSLNTPQASAPSRMTVRGSIKLTMAEVR